MNSIELFAGAGGLAMGVALAGFRHAMVVERDKHCCDTLKLNLQDSFGHGQDWKIVGEDIRGLNFAELSNQIDLVSGGPPCQPFSIGGRHQAHADSRDMFPEAVRALRDLRPKAFIFENVKGLKRSTFANYLEYIKLQMKYPDVVALPTEDWLDHLRRLEKHDTGGGANGPHYRVVAEVLNAADYGIPQRRERLFFVGFRSDLNIEWAFPGATHSQDALLWDQVHGDYWNRHGVPPSHRRLSDRAKERALKILERPSLLPWRTVRDAIGDLPPPASKGNERIPNHVSQPGARCYTGHTGSPMDEPAKTLKAGVHGVPGGENMLLRPNGTVRYFTIRESARLQTFPDSFVFRGSWTESMRQLGNAVPVELGRLIAEDVAKHLRRQHKA